MIRDLMLRYGREQLGFAWLALEPMLLTVGVLVMWTLIKGSHEHGVRVLELVLTGYMPLTLWRHITNPMILYHRRNLALRYHSRISLFDIVASKLILEFAGTTAALLFVYFSLLAWGVVTPVADWGLLIAGWVAMASFASGAALLILTITECSEVAEKFIQTIQYLLLPISGFFFLVDWLPDSIKPLALLNPMVHCFESFRAGYFGESVPTHYSLVYLGTWSFFLLALGTIATNRYKDQFQIS